jgi:hypothetical protein
MSNVPPTYEDFIRIFREAIDEHLHWQEAQGFHGVLSLETGWRQPARTVFEQMEHLRTAGKIPSPRFEKALADFYWLYAS